MLRTVFSILLALGLTACVAAPRLTRTAESQVMIEDRLGAPDPADTARLAAARPFFLGPMDMVRIQIIGLEELTTETQIDNGGRIQLPLIGSVEAAGKSLAQLSDELNAIYGRTYLRDPRVAVSLMETKSLFVSIEGAVRQPGVYPAVGALRINSALALAQGTSEFAAFDNVAVFRTIGGRQHAAIFNLRDIRSGKYEDPEIYPNDTVIVGESAVRRVFRDIVQTAPFVAVFRPFN